jgi:hypothetical protein
VDASFFRKPFKDKPDLQESPATASCSAIATNLGRR